MGVARGRGGGGVVSMKGYKWDNFEKSQMPSRWKAESSIQSQARIGLLRLRV